MSHGRSGAVLDRPQDRNKGPWYDLDLEAHEAEIEEIEERTFAVWHATDVADEIVLDAAANLDVPDLTRATYGLLEMLQRHAREVDSDQVARLARSALRLLQPEEPPPFEYHLGFDGLDFVATEPVTDMYGVGRTPAAAAADLAATLREYRDVLRNDEPDLSARLQHHLSHLDQLIETQ